jgi:hypothetical protein
LLHRTEIIRQSFSMSDEVGWKQIRISMHFHDQQWSSIMSRMLSLVFRHYVKAVLTAALLVSAASAHAGPSRGLSLATAEAPPANPTSKSTDAASPPAPAASPVTEPENKTHNTPAEPATEARPPKKHKVGTEARIILYELHRHGIYW